MKSDKFAWDFIIPKLCDALSIFHYVELPPGHFAMSIYISIFKCFFKVCYLIYYLFCYQAF